MLVVKEQLGSLQGFILKVGGAKIHVTYSRLHMILTSSQCISA